MAVVTPTYAQSDLMTFTYQDLMNWSQLIADSTGGNLQQYFDVAAQFGVGEEQAMLDFLAPDEGSFGIQATKMADGTYSGYIFQGPEEVITPNPVNSNSGTVSRASLRQMVGQKFEDVEGTLVRNMTRYPSAGGMGQKAAYVFGSIGSAVGAVSTGIWLGKTIDSALYNANPDFWNNIGLSSLNPETWSSLTNGSDSPFAGLLNFVLGLDPDTGNAQMYMNQDALAYIAYVMAQAGIFGSGGYDYVDKSDLYTGLDVTPYVNVKTLGTALSGYSGFYNETTRKMFNASVNNVGVVVATSFGLSFVTRIAMSGADYIPCNVNVDVNSSKITTVSDTIAYISPVVSLSSSDAHVSSGAYMFFINSRGQVDYASTSATGISRAYWGPVVESYNQPALILATPASTAPDGISDQTGATLPNTSTWDSPASTLTSLQQQYPDAFNNAMTWDNYADDGTPAQTTWIPVPFPNTTFANDTQPTSGEQTQTSVNISDLPETLIKVITEIVQQTQTETEPKPVTPPQNPADTGTGEPPVLVPPSGSASALWSVYHPTPQQVNDFGAWLWTDNVIEQFLRLMNNPMEGIIALHKVYAMPVDAGTATIVVGRLDSNVSSATVTQQYVYVDCGTVQLNEQFVNVFDYQPFTSVSLYLPFIGIVPLDVGDVMRSSIHIKYGVDVFTGACLAMVEVIRDGNTVNMYQYTGVASVSYPLTGAQNSGLLSGLLGIAAGIGTIAATGNPAGLGMAVSGAVNATRVNMGRSGGFSGNAGAMGIKKPYLIITRPQTMVAQTFPNQQGYPTNYSATLGSYTGFVQCRALHVESTCATRAEISEIQSLLRDGVMV